MSRAQQCHPAVAAPAADPGLGARARALARLSRDELETTFLRGEMPDVTTLVGRELRGTNLTPLAQLAGIEHFIKGFSARGDQGEGYNRSARSGAAGKRYGFYRVARVDPAARDNHYLHALLLDYGRGGNPRLDPTRGLRDYLVRVDPGDDDLFLGKAYYAGGPLRVPISFFVLEGQRRS